MPATGRIGFGKGLLMAQMPRELDAFAAKVAEMLRELKLEAMSPLDAFDTLRALVERARKT